MRREDAMDLAKRALARIAIIAGVFACAYFFFGCSRILYNTNIVSHSPLLIRSGDPPSSFLENLNKRYHLHSIVNLRGATSKSEEAFLGKYPGVVLYLFHWSASRRPPREDIDRLLNIYRDPKNFPMLVHCKAGADRTGLAVALWRVERENKSIDEALAEMKWYRHIVFIRPDMQQAVAEYYEEREKQSLLRRVFVEIKLLVLAPLDFVQDFFEQLAW